MEFLQYLLRSALVLTTLYIPFQLLLRKESNFRLNRALLIGTLLTSLMLPLSHHNIPDALSELWASKQYISPIMVQGSDGLIIVTSEAEDLAPSWFSTHWPQLLIIGWAVGAIMFLLWQMAGVIRLYKLLHGRETVTEILNDGNILHLIASPIPSFSWMHHIVISAEDYGENREIILCHERAHIASHHSIDKLLLIGCQTIQWWNPFVWLLGDALCQTHEYEADQMVINHGINATQYQLLLISKAAGPAGLAMVNGFKHNKLKYRIIMMNQTKHSRHTWARYMVILPMMLIAFALTAQEKAKEIVKTVSSEVSEVKVMTEEEFMEKCQDMTQSQEPKMRIQINQKNEVMVDIDNENKPQRVDLATLKQKISSSEIGPNDIVFLDFDPSASEQLLSDIKDYLRKNNVHKIQHRTSQWYQAEQVSPQIKTSGDINQVLILVNDEELEGDLKSLNPENIESIEVLKDDESKIKYTNISPKAKNGVILIKTK